MYLLTSEFLIARFPYNAVRINRVIGGFTVHIDCVGAKHLIMIQL